MSNRITSTPRGLGGRRSRRVVVGVVVVVTALLGSLVPASLHGFAILLVLLLAGLDVSLIGATDALAFTNRRALDERERALRDMAYRRGFRLLGLAFVVEILILIATGILAFYISDAAHGLGTSVVESGVPGRALVGLLEALIMLPAQPQITSCGADNLDDFATVSATSCSALIDSAGTLHYTMHARVSAPFGIGQHDVTLSLVVDRNGHVLERP